MYSGHATLLVETFKLLRHRESPEPAQPFCKAGARCQATAAAVRVIITAFHCQATAAAVRVIITAFHCQQHFAVKSCNAACCFSDDLPAYELVQKQQPCGVHAALPSTGGL